MSPMLQSALLVPLIQALCLYTRYSPVEKGRWRVIDLIHACASRVPRQYSMVVQSSDGRRFRIAPAERQYHMGLLDRGMFEPDVTAVATRWLTPGMVAIDAGANFGWYTTLFSRLVGPHGEVHAFEPVAETAAILTENTRLNGCCNVRINRLALGEKEGQSIVYYDPATACGDASMFPVSGTAAQPNQCRVITLDAYVAEHGLTRCDFIKCDVEGAELAFLRGADAVLATYKPVLLIEINPSTLMRAHSTGQQVLEEISRHGDYIFELVDSSPSRPRRIEPRDCSTLQTYINVLCYPSPRLGHG